MAELTGWDKDTSPFHEGEQFMQERYGLKEQQEAIGKRLMRPYMPTEHRAFFAQLPFAVVGSIDDKGQPWASMVFGRPGFISTPTDKRLNFDTHVLNGDPLKENVGDGKPLSLLGIELPTRRRNRVNMIATGTGSSGFGAKVVQSFGNCPKYIQTRSVEFSRDPRTEPPDIVPQHFTELSTNIASLIGRADTFFVASHNNKDDQTDTGGVDVNHRGGQSGFVNVDGNRLTIPDYSGNYLFNTLGNFLVNPKAGLLFVDFESGDIVYLTGTTEILWEDHPEVEAFKGADRGWRFKLERGILLKNAAPIRARFDEYAPTSVKTGTWDEAQNVIALQKKRREWLSYKVAKVVDEDEFIRSFYLEPQDIAKKLPFKAGQFLSVRLKLEDTDRFVGRNYTVSSAPSDPFLRISVKREVGVDGQPDGRVSNYLHNHLVEGSIIEAKGPSGAFVLDNKTQRPVVLIGAGVGITPIISMFRDFATAIHRFGQSRSVTVIQAARKTSNLVFSEEFDSLQSEITYPTQHFSVVSQPDSNQKASVDFGYKGHLSADMLKEMLPNESCDVYICGPSGFMQNTYDALLSLGVSDKQIHTESFGPAVLKRRKDAIDEEVLARISAQEAKSGVVRFSDAKVEQAWTAQEGTLLELAENHGLKPAFACRNGVCGECAVKITQGKVAYKHVPAFETDSSEVLICCAVPAKEGSDIVLKL
jgi:ferredoxin-NADP reductase/predicted pyridoxine 5'-phosphate oxidase superfamily flavin-nucleotide-binding protein